MKMKTKGTVLSREEREIIILAALNQNGKFLSNNGIGRRLGMPAKRVNMIVHQACIKLGARDRNEAILLALKRGEINIDEFWSPDELVKIFSLLNPDMLIRMAGTVSQELEHKHLFKEDDKTILTSRRHNSEFIDRGESGSTLLKKKNTSLTQQERDLLIMTALHPKGKLLSSSEIGQRLGMSASRVNSIIHQACVKLGAHNRYRATNIALRQREIILTDIWSLDELAELFSSLGPDMLKRIANIVHRGQEHKHLLKKSMQIAFIGRRKDGILTNRERDVVILAGLGFVNREIADSLNISTGSVRIFLNRASTKLGVNKRSEVFILALKNREISLADVFSLNEIINYLAPLGVESIENMAQLLDQKLWQESMSAGS